MESVSDYLAEAMYKGESLVDVAKLVDDNRKRLDKRLRGQQGQDANDNPATGYSIPPDRLLSILAEWVSDDALAHMDHCIAYTSIRNPNREDSNTCGFGEFTRPWRATRHPDLDRQEARAMKQLNLVVYQRGELGES